MARCWKFVAAILTSTALLCSVTGLSVTPPQKPAVGSSSAPSSDVDVEANTMAANAISRRQAILTSVASAASILGSVGFPEASSAAADCYDDCLKNCKKIAPNDPDYCRNNCIDYCSQEDRRDGLSGSVSAEGGEVGLLGGTFGQGTVPKGEDKPPSVKLPGLDFTSGKGKKLLGY
eukprot:CAMPEP_0113518170 /NCGR_PEP_ID=MMETSP0014_2-20120614/42711_1 /TAXON_ID=2857 /ORGANISM="Nitzschia sp." /LENGTH=175 /DNA_ID=CAMNT_0000415539 /DNA_START=75 /DNA_END=602 /DNA_ORIENTATION=- /assembly_acc=CAM_ASM_000159